MLTRFDAVDGKQTVIDILRSWEKGDAKFNEKKINTWLNDGSVFWLDPEVTEKLCQTESSNDKRHLGFLKNCYTTADVFINIAKDRSVIPFRKF